MEDPETERLGGQRLWAFFSSRVWQKVEPKATRRRTFVGVHMRYRIRNDLRRLLFSESSALMCLMTPI
jgi:hypothetical protein